MPTDLTSLEEEVHSDPRKGRFYELAREYQRLGMLDKAVITCEEGLEINPNRWQARILLAQVCVAKGDLDNAEVQVQKVLLALPDNVPANHLAADIFFSRGEPVKALKHYKIVQLFEPGIQQVDERVRKLESGNIPEKPVESVVETHKSAENPVASVKAGDEDKDTVKQSFANETIEINTAALHQVEQNEQSDSAEKDEVKDLSELDVSEFSDPGVTEPDEGSSDQNREDVSDTERFDVFGSDEDVELGEDLVEKEGLDDWEDTRESPSPSEDEISAESADTDESESVFPEEDIENLTDAADTADTYKNNLTFGTNTLAEMYEQQGYPEKAIEVYQRILLKDPNNEKVLKTIEGLKRKVLGETVENPAVEDVDVKRAIRMKRISILENWLDNLRERTNV